MAEFMMDPGPGAVMDYAINFIIWPSRVIKNPKKYAKQLILNSFAEMNDAKQAKKSLKIKW